MIHVALDCGPPELDNGEIDFNSTTFPSEANYTCDEGYYPSSFASISTCEADGEWSELLCISKDCALTSCPYHCYCRTYCISTCGHYNVLFI